jgi:hypothetical protein
MHSFPPIARLGLKELRMKKSLLIGIVALAAIALAVDGVTGSEGQGTARTQDGRVGNFRYRAVKITRGEHTGYDGTLRFQQVANEHGRAALIEMGKPAGVEVTGNICRFRGPGSLTAVDNTGHRRTIRGMVAVMATDIRTHAHPDGHDLFAIHFTNADHNVTFDFEGAVGTGDLVVFTRTR